MIGTTRSRVSFFMNRFRKLGYIEYNGRIRVNTTLLDMVLHDALPEENARGPCCSTPHSARHEPPNEPVSVNCGLSFVSQDRTETARATALRRFYVIWTLCCRVRNHDHWAGLRRAPDSPADALDYCRRSCNDRHWDSVGSKGYEAERFRQLGSAIDDGMDSGGIVPGFSKDAVEISRTFEAGFPGAASAFWEQEATQARGASSIS